MAFNIMGSDIYLPQQTWNGEDFDRHLGLKLGTSQRKYGVEKRYIAASHETAIMMAGEAIIGALKNACMRIQDIDFILYASATHHQTLPYDAAAVLAYLKAPAHLTSVDINSSCLSFLSALDYAQCLFLAKRHRRIVIVSSECGTGITLNKTTPASFEVATLFSDGAAAYVLQADPLASGFTGALFETHHQGYELCQVKGGGSAINPHTTAHADLVTASQFEMNGKALFREMVKAVPTFLEKGLKRAEVNKQHIDYVLPHQASHRAINKLPRIIGFADHKVVNNVAQLGNQIAASLPINLHFLRQQIALDREQTKQSNPASDKLLTSKTTLKPTTLSRPTKSSEPKTLTTKTVLLFGTAAGLSLGMGLLTL
ncbi:3-oxoacyl-[acyl-carrier-protein] synthase III C-terminal domain-containing protein [Psychromonas sp. SA13A]|uniref:3-oxoacyl-ACP synthase III family protein n=1 Tax=Psychromonas sp. SA13A TaxID=2686346 RepID=UPI00140C7075|nr:3-oxoacyl-[acyl-carrier-protein] synthase III C-terminal domain-containing protein [Psychromonas sp. SA13A]